MHQNGIATRQLGFPNNHQAASPPGSKPPYSAPTASLGGVPSHLPDIPISAVLIGLFACSAATHLFFFQRNLRRRPGGYKFIFSFLLFVFSCTRIAALSLRVKWATVPTDANIALAATVLTSAGVLILFIVNLVLARRVIRGLHPRFGWSKGVDWGFKGLIVTVVGTLIMVVVCSVHSMFTLDAVARGRERNVLLFAGVYMAVVAFLPAVTVTVAKLVPNTGPHPSEGFGKGALTTKAALLVFTSLFLTLGAGFRAGVNFAPTPKDQPQWYHSKPAFYCFNFAIELLVVYTYAIFRFDQRFHVPVGSSEPGHYSGARQIKGQDAQELDDRDAGSGGSAITEDLREKDGVGRHGRSAV
ncbi:hypothetical protein C8A00DRAFT_45492 [Chaetomidium leptoderma]|uniref:Uncharacterized protein n=1 Tax=Chaetomidium leptoderma TaxID=669021 RepID=A0AAN6ZWD2_9PEZI|nr:hypothetical protein C8A00DRAFT_45492 [Chaetomidium leptoderma]